MKERRESLSLLWSAAMAQNKIWNRTRYESTRFKGRAMEEKRRGKKKGLVCLEDYGTCKWHWRRLKMIMSRSRRSMKAKHCYEMKKLVREREEVQWQYEKRLFVRGQHA